MIKQHKIRLKLFIIFTIIVICISSFFITYTEKEYIGKRYVVSNIANQKSIFKELKTLMLETIIKYEQLNIEAKKKKLKEIKNPYVDIIDNLTEEEKELLLNITYAEAGNQGVEGQRAVIEVIFNRINSEDFPNSLIEVLSQEGQFSTWKVRNIVERDELPELSLEEVYLNEPILPDESYVFFGRGKKSYAKEHVKIGDHWFGSY